MITPTRPTGRKPPMALRHTRIDLNQRPFIVIWETTRACDLACQHCRAEAVPDRDPRELDTAAAKGLMDQVLAVGSPPPVFVITGGDPFKRDDLYELVSYGSGIGLPVAVSPSGTENLRRDNLLRLREAGARVISLSLDGADAATHDAFRGVAGSYRHTLAGWDTALDIGLKVQINTTVTPGNLDQLADLLALIHARGVLTWSMFFLVPTGRGDGLDQLSVQQAEDALNFCYDADKIVSLKTTEAPQFRRVCVQRQVLADHGLDPVAELGLGPDYRALLSRMAELLPVPADTDRIRRPPLEVSAARGFVFISHTGDVYPSGFLPLVAGNIHTQPLGRIYRDSELFRTIRDPDSLPGRCGSCEFRAVCGGSRPRAFGTTGNLLADEPLCEYVPGSFGFADEVASYLTHSGVVKPA